jgi:microcystin-dependent protein
MANIISTLKNNYAGGNGSITAGQVKIYAFDGQPNDAYTGFTFTIENKATTTCIIDCIEFKFPTTLIPDSLSNINYAGLLSILQTTFRNSSSISVTDISNGLVTIQAKFPSSQQIKLSRNHKVNFNLLGLYAKSNLTSAIQEFRINLYANRTIIAASISQFVIDSTQVSPTTRVLITNPPKITIDNFSFGVIGNSYIINTREEQFIDLYMNVVGMTADAPLTFTNSAGNEPHLCIGFYTNSANNFSPEPLQDSLFIDTEAGLANYTVSYKGQNKIVESNNIGNIFRAMGDSIVTADLPMNNTISLSSRANFCAAKFIIDAGTSSLSGWYRFKIKIKLLNDINYGIVNISIQVYIDNKTLYYEVPITISPFNIVNGNLGIGIANPQSKLEVNGNFEVINGFLKIGFTSNSYGITGGLGSRIEFGSAGYTNSKPNVSIEESYGLNLIGSTGKPVKILSADLIVNDGNLGIGNANPSKKLDVTGDAHVSGATTLDGMVTVGTNNTNADLVVKGRIRDKTGDVMPVGAIIAFGGASLPPAGWLLCNGQSIASDPADRSYQNLRSTLGANNVPDLRARFILGSGDGSMNFTGSPSEAILLDDSNAYTMVGSIPSFTYEVWFKTVNIAAVNNYNSILVKQSGWGLYVDYKGRLVSFCYANMRYNRISIKACTDGLWHHAVISFNNTSDYKVYLDGELLPNDNNLYGYQLSVNPLNKRLYIGGADSDSGVIQPFFGDIKRVKVYNRALTAPEVQSQLIAKGEETSNLSGLRIDKVLTSKTGGEYEHKLSVQEMPQHNHSPVDGVGFLTGNASSGAAGYLSAGDGLFTPIARNTITSNSGGNQPHNNMPPYYALTYIIKY